MARSRNSRKGSTNRHRGRHEHCLSPGCPRCRGNQTHGEARQAPAPDRGTPGTPQCLCGHWGVPEDTPCPVHDQDSP